VPAQEFPAGAIHPVGRAVRAGLWANGSVEGSDQDHASIWVDPGGQVGGGQLLAEGAKPLGVGTGLGGGSEVLPEGVQEQALVGLNQRCYRLLTLYFTSFTLPSLTIVPRRDRWRYCFGASTPGAKGVRTTGVWKTKLGNGAGGVPAVLGRQGQALRVPAGARQP
jgi:hypothetical protein